MSNITTTLRIKIDVTKIDKKRLYVGKKGTYLEATILLRDEEDQHGNHGMVIESVSKEEREAGKDGTILGNVTGRWDRGASKPQPSASKPAPADDDDDLPF